MSSSASSDRVLATILDATDEAIVATDRAGIVLTWNRGAERMYGYTATEILQKPISLLASPERGEGTLDLVRQIAAGASLDPLETIHVGKDGQRIDVLITAAPILDDGGAIVGTVVVTRDITSERRAERQHRIFEARARAIVDTAVDGIVTIDRHGRIETFNPAAERLFQYASRDVAGKNISVLMPEPYASEHDHYMRRYLTTGEPHIIGIGREVTAKRKDGTTFPVHLSVAEMTIDGEIKFTGIIRDLTERVKLEGKLREESGLVRLGELAAVLAHEVKNPLAAVGGAIQVLTERLTTPEDREIAEEVLRRLDALSAMMGDLLLYARPPKPKLVRLRIADLVESLVAFMQLDQGWRGVEIDVSGEPAEVLGDAELLKVALQNLLVNSVQAMGGTGKIGVHVGVANGEVQIDIRDAGPGIPPEVQSRMYTPFFTTKARGTGLGLATVSRIAEAHRGSVRIVSTDSAGTTMRFSLPVLPTDAV